MRGAERLAAELRDRGVGDRRREPLPSEEHFDAVVRERGRAPGAASSRLRRPRWLAARSTRQPTVISPQRPLRARARGLRPGRRQPRLGRARREQIVFAHTHQPLADVRSAATARTRYWNTGSWIYEPDLGSRQAYARYLRYAWPGTAILIDDEEPEPRLLELLADLNPLNGGPGLPPAP